MGEGHEPLCILDDDCPLRQMFDLVGDRWTSSVLFVIGEDVKRYSDLQRQIPGVSKKMLTQTLRRLEQAGLVSRKVYPVVPPRTEYRLTSIGKSILEPVSSMAEWAVRHQRELKQIRSNREAHQ
ncbi:MAG: helix-turn-helix domain-containing protein [Planctomycetaceae bacterium]|nr:helix-turn-helix domain-containing protein [Planctomycetaceae bacterium]